MRRLLPLLPPVLLLAALAPAAPAQAPEDEWTLLVYLAADNDLEEFAPGDLEEMAAGIVGDAANVLVLHDRAEGHDDSDGDWTEARLLQWAGDGWHAIEDWGEPNMGDAATLAEFVAAGLLAFPAERTALVVWDHGGGWQGVAYDDSHGSDGLTLLELSHGLAQGLAAAGVPRLDVLAFDACFMATLEVAEAVAPHARLMVASQDLVPGEGFAYAPFLEALSSGRDPLAASVALVDGFTAYYAPTGDAATLSVVDLARVDDLLHAMRGLRDAVAAAPMDAAFDHAWATQGAPRFALPDAKTRSSVDLFAVADAASRFAHAPLAAAARDVLSLERDVVLHESHSAEWAGVRGLSHHGVLDPLVLDATAQSYVEIPEASAGISGSLVEVAGALQAEDSEPPLLSPLEGDASRIEPGREETFLVTVADPHLAGVALLLMSEGDDGVLYLDQEIPLFPEDATEDEAGNLVARWAAEEELEVAWDGYAYALETDEDSFLAPFREARAGSPFYELWGSLERRDGHTLDEVLLRFDVRDGALASAWDLGDYREIGLREGDAFLMAWEGYDEEGDLLEGLTELIRVGPSGFRMVDAPAPPGEYFLAVLARDLVGNADVTDMLLVEVAPAETETDETPPQPRDDHEAAPDEDSPAPTPDPGEAPPADGRAPGGVLEMPQETPWPHVAGIAVGAAVAWATRRRRRA